MYLFEELNKMGTTVVVATHNEGLVSRFTHRQLRIAQGTVKLVDPSGAAIAVDEPAAESGRQESA
jgi:cell division transport system ATP-binding protein